MWFFDKLFQTFYSLQLLPSAAFAFTPTLNKNLFFFSTAALMVGMDLEGGRFFFNAVREGDSILFASDDENECSLWVMALYRATGQSHKPTPPLTSGQNSSISKLQGDADKARKHGMEDYISADPCQFEHAHLFKLLQNLTLDYRLNDPFASMVSAGLNKYATFSKSLRINYYRDGSVQVKCLCLTSIAPVTAYAAATGISAI